MRKSRFQEGVEKNVDFRDPFFLNLADFRCSGGPQNGGIMEAFSLLFRSWGLLFLLGGHFWLFSTIFVFLDLFFDDVS